MGGIFARLARTVLAEDVIEPPVPAGLGKLDASLTALVAFLRIDHDLLGVAASVSAPLAPPPKQRALSAWIKALPANEKDNVLMRVLADGPHAAVEFRDRFFAEQRSAPRGKPRTTRRRTARDLVSGLG